MLAIGHVGCLDDCAANAIFVLLIHLGIAQLLVGHFKQHQIEQFLPHLLFNRVLLREVVGLEQGPELCDF